MEVFKSSKEEQFLPALVKPGARNNHWAADAAPGIIELVLGPGSLRVVLQPIVRVQNVIPGVQESIAVERRAARLRD